MKSNINPYQYFLKVLLVLNIICMGSANMYAQDSLAVAQISLSFSEENDIKMINAIVTDQAGIPIEDLELYFFVKRTFSLLPIGDAFNATDENGIIEIEFPNDLPGDPDGNVEIVVKIIESDLYNDLSLEMTKNWGIPTQLDLTEEKRSLWAAAANAPITLVLVTSGMILVIWFIVFYIIFVLFKISKITPIKT